jgi:hypothetical protein
MDPRRRSRPAWAQVTIHLNLLDIPAATAAATSAMRTARLPGGSPFMYGQVTGSIDIPPRWCYMNPARKIAVINEDVWETHQGHPTLGEFCERIRFLTDPVFVRYDPESWVLLDQLNSAENGRDPAYWPGA